MEVESHNRNDAAHPKKKAIKPFNIRRITPARIARPVRRLNSINDETKQQAALKIQAPISPPCRMFGLNVNNARSAAAGIKARIRAKPGDFFFSSVWLLRGSFDGGVSLFMAQDYCVLQSEKPE
jgi:hypothetical protein